MSHEQTARTTSSELLPPSPESLVSLDLHKYVRDITSSHAFEEEFKFLEAQVQSDPKLLHQHELDRQRKDKLEAVMRADGVEAWDLNQEVNDIDDRARADQESYLAYRRIKAKQESLKTYNTYQAAAGSEVGILIMNAITEAGLKTQDNESTAPFANFRQNTKEAWAYVPDQAVRDYLDSRTFMDTSMVLKAEHNPLNEDHNRIEITAADGEALDVPTNIVVYAAGFASWRGRPKDIGKSWGSSEYGWQTGQSIDAIKHYAGLNTDVPPVTAMYVYVQPDGRIFADNGNGDSHRIAAAILRGDRTIKARSIIIRVLSENYLKD